MSRVSKPADRRVVPQVVFTTKKELKALSGNYM
jgi:hypothetical protein